MKKLLSFIFLTLIILGCSCDSTEPIDNRQLSIIVEDVSCVEAWLKLKTANITLPANINITANSNLIEQFTLTSGDTLIFVDSLLPSTHYSFRALSGEVRSEKTSVVTMDTTSHNFTWETYTFGGDGGSSYLKDVAIISENNIWAVGEIYENGGKYNAVHWDGNEWGLKKILVNFHGNTVFLPLEGIHAFTESDIWLVGSLPIHGNGENWTIYDVREITNSNLSLSSAWGSSSEDLYFVGRSGSIVHYDGNNWRKMESGTELDIYDIWGDYNDRIGEYEILAVAAKLLNSSDRDILKISENKATRLNEEDISQPLRSVWFKSNRLYIVGGSGRYIKRNLNDNLWSRQWSNITNYSTNKIRGTNLNNIFIIGSFGEVLHYNGFTWHSYLNKELPQFYGELYGISVDDTIVCLVGQDQRECKIYMGKKGGK